MCVSVHVTAVSPNPLTTHDEPLWQPDSVKTDSTGSRTRASNVPTQNTRKPYTHTPVARLCWLPHDQTLGPVFERPPAAQTAAKRYRHLGGTDTLFPGEAVLGSTPQALQQYITASHQTQPGDDSQTHTDTDTETQARVAQPCRTTLHPPLQVAAWKKTTTLHRLSAGTPSSALCRRTRCWGAAAAAAAAEKTLGFRV